MSLAIEMKMGREKSEKIVAAERKIICEIANRLSKYASNVDSQVTSPVIVPTHKVSRLLQLSLAINVVRRVTWPETAQMRTLDHRKHAGMIELPMVHALIVVRWVIEHSNARSHASKEIAATSKMVVEVKEEKILEVVVVVVILVCRVMMKVSKFKLRLSVGAEAVIAVAAEALALIRVMTRLKHSVVAEITLEAVEEASSATKVMREASEVAEEVTVVVGEALVEIRAMKRHKAIEVKGVALEVKEVALEAAEEVLAVIKAIVETSEEAEEITEVVGEALVEIKVMMKPQVTEVAEITIEDLRVILAAAAVVVPSNREVVGDPEEKVLEMSPTESFSFN